jgi:hypothetical protein
MLRAAPRDGINRTKADPCFHADDNWIGYALFLAGARLRTVAKVSWSGKFERDGAALVAAEGEIRAWSPLKTRGPFRAILRCGQRLASDLARRYALFKAGEGPPPPNSAHAASGPLFGGGGAGTLGGGGAGTFGGGGAGTLGGAGTTKEESRFDRRASGGVAALEAATGVAWPELRASFDDEEILALAAESGVDLAGLAAQMKWAGEL